MENENGEKNIIGYGDPECGKSCLARKASMYRCELMVLCTGLQVKAAMEGDLLKAGAYENQQNKHAIALGCKPGFNRI